MWKDVLEFDMPTVRHAEEVPCLRRLQRFVQNVNVTFEYCGLDLCCFENPIKGFYLVKDTDNWWHELKFKSWHRHHFFVPRLVGQHSLKLFKLPPSERNDFYIAVPHG